MRRQLAVPRRVVALRGRAGCRRLRITRGARGRTACFLAWAAGRCRRAACFLRGGGAARLCAWGGRRARAAANGCERSSDESGFNDGKNVDFHGDIVTQATVLRADPTARVGAGYQGRVRENRMPVPFSADTVATPSPAPKRKYPFDQSRSGVRWGKRRALRLREQADRDPCAFACECVNPSRSSPSDSADAERAANLRVHPTSKSCARGCRRCHRAQVCGAGKAELAVMTWAHEEP